MLRPVPGVMDGSGILLLEWGMGNPVVAKGDIYRVSAPLTSAGTRTFAA